MKSHGFRIFVLLNVWVLVMVTFLSGCSSIVGYGRMYDGQPKALENIALLTHANPYSQTILLQSIDGRQMTLGGLVELTPGQHAICAGFFRSVGGSSYRRSKGCATVQLNALPGHVYVIYDAINTHNDSWHPAIRDITSELAAPEQADLAAKIDAILSKNRPDTPSAPVSSLAAGQPTEPLKGFHEKMTADLSPWLKQPVSVSYDFYRYRPFIIAKASDGQNYHFQIDPYSGRVVHVFGKKVDPGGKWEMINAFQPLNSDMAYVRGDTGRVRSIYEEQADGSYKLQRTIRYSRYDDFVYHALIKAEWLEGLSKNGVSALVLAHNAAPARLAEYASIQKEITGLKKDRVLYILRKKAFVLAMAAQHQARQAIVEAKPEQKALLEQNLARCNHYFKVLLRDDNLIEMPTIALDSADVKFFPTGYKMVPYEKRQYASVLSRKDTTFVGWQLNLTMPAPGKKISYLVKALWFKPDGTLLTHQSWEASCQADWTQPWHAVSWGYRKPGSWSPGTYRVAFYINGNPVTEQMFTIQ